MLVRLGGLSLNDDAEGTSRVCARGLCNRMLTSLAPAVYKQGHVLLLVKGDGRKPAEGWYLAGQGLGESRGAW